MKNIILTGFMGTGKTTVGKELAKKLSRNFIDMDERIEYLAGKSVAKIFSEDGESIFRRMESNLCAELSKQQDLVIAAGGGALVNPDNKMLLEENGILICLDCNIDELVKRLDKGTDRPLLNVADRHSEILKLLDSRKALYEQISYHIDTTRSTLESLVDDIVNIVSMSKLSIHFPGGKYQAFIGENSLLYLGEILRSNGISTKRRIAIVSNPVVAPIYGHKVELSLQKSGYQSFFSLMPDGEQYKTLNTVSQLYEQFLEGGLTRQDIVLGLGGGVVGDVSGFAAATYLRGVSFIQIPTTLLSMVDSSVGGKTGVDLPQGKNLVGAFKQPLVVVIDPCTLATLPIEELRSGVAEVIKCGILKDIELFSTMEKKAGEDPTWWQNQLGVTAIIQALNVKISIVEEDPYEEGIRIILNLGHTVGHAIEKISNYTVQHGMAVSIGLVASARIAEDINLAESSFSDRIEEILKAWKLPTSLNGYSINDIIGAMSFDKKKQDNQIRWVLPNTIGNVTINTNVPISTVQKVLLSMGAK